MLVGVFWDFQYFDYNNETMTIIRYGSLNFFDQGDAKNITMKKVIKKTFFSFRYPRSYQIVFPNK